MIISSSVGCPYMAGVLCDRNVCPEFKIRAPYMRYGARSPGERDRCMPETAGNHRSNC